MTAVQRNEGGARPEGWAQKRAPLGGGSGAARPCGRAGHRSDGFGRVQRGEVAR